MKLRPGLMALVAVMCLWAWTGAYAQEGSADSVAELKQAQEDLRAEVEGLKGELAGLRLQLNQIMKQIVDLKKPQAQPRQPQRQRPAMDMLGQPAPAFDVTTYQGNKTTVGGKRDKPQVVFCWASWCGYCRKSLPWINSLHQDYKDKGVEVLAVNLDQREGRRAKTVEDTLKVYNDIGATLPMTMTTDTNDTSRIGTTYKATSFPTLFVIGQSGNVEAVHIGAKATLKEDVSGELDKLLAGQTLAKPAPKPVAVVPDKPPTVAAKPNMIKAEIKPRTP